MYFFHTSVSSQLCIGLSLAHLPFSWLMFFPLTYSYKVVYIIVKTTKDTINSTTVPILSLLKKNCQYEFRIGTCFTRDEYKIGRKLFRNQFEDNLISFLTMHFSSNFILVSWFSPYIKITESKYQNISTYKRI